MNILKEKLADIHPVDLADIMEELDSSQRALLLGGLETEHASGTLEEIDTAVQRDIVFALSKERAAELIEQAVRRDRPLSRAEDAEILALLEQARELEARDKHDRKTHYPTN